MEGGDSEKRRDWMCPAIRQKKGQHVFFRPLPPIALPSFLVSHHKHLSMYQIRCIQMVYRYIAIKLRTSSAMVKHKIA